MNTEFNFDLQQWNTLKVSGLAAYLQRPERDRVGWILAQGVWLPDWRPKKWAIQIQKLVVTFESFETVQQLEQSETYFEPWDYFMLTEYEMFITDDQHTAEQYFAKYTDKPEFAQHPDRVNCPHEFNNKELSYDLPAYWSLQRRSVVDTLIHLKEAGRKVTWQEGNDFFSGYIGKIYPAWFEMMTPEGKKSIGLGPSDGLRITTVEPDGYIATHWRTSCRLQGHFPENLPIWSEAADDWIYLDRSVRLR